MKHVLYTAAGAADDATAYRLGVVGSIGDRSSDLIARSNMIIMIVERPRPDDERCESRHLKFRCHHFKTGMRTGRRNPYYAVAGSMRAIRVETGTFEKEVFAFSSLRWQRNKQTDRPRPRANIAAVNPSIHSHPQ